MFLTYLNLVISSIILPMLYLQLSNAMRGSLSLTVFGYIILITLLFAEWFFLLYDTTSIINTNLEKMGVYNLVEKEPDESARLKIKMCSRIASLITVMSFLITALVF